MRPARRRPLTDRTTGSILLLGSSAALRAWPRLCRPESFGRLVEATICRCMENIRVFGDVVRARPVPSAVIGLSKSRRRRLRCILGRVILTDDAGTPRRLKAEVRNLPPARGNPHGAFVR